jgi:hypothetical protein
MILDGCTNKLQGTIGRPGPQVEKDTARPHCY